MLVATKAPSKPLIADSFEPFAKLGAVKYRQDTGFFYVESNSMPDHKMMDERTRSWPVNWMSSAVTVVEAAITTITSPPRTFKGSLAKTIRSLMHSMAMRSMDTPSQTGRRSRASISSTAIQRQGLAITTTQPRLIPMSTVDSMVKSLSAMVKSIRNRVLVLFVKHFRRFEVARSLASKQRITRALASKSKSVARLAPKARLTWISLNGPVLRPASLYRVRQSGQTGCCRSNLLAMAKVHHHLSNGKTRRLEPKHLLSVFGIRLPIKRSLIGWSTTFPLMLVISTRTTIERELLA